MPDFVVIVAAALQEKLDTIERLEKDQSDWRKGVELISAALGEKSLSCVHLSDVITTRLAASQERISQLETALKELLDHIHDDVPHAYQKRLMISSLERLLLSHETKQASSATKKRIRVGWCGWHGDYKTELPYGGATYETCPSCINERNDAALSTGEKEAIGVPTCCDECAPEYIDGKPVCRCHCHDPEEENG